MSAPAPDWKEVADRLQREGDKLFSLGVSHGDNAAKVGAMIIEAVANALTAGLSKGQQS